MKRSLTKIVIAIAVLAIPAQLRLAAQNQPQSREAPPRFTLATANYNLLIASGFLCEDADGCPAVAQDSDGKTIEVTGTGAQLTVRAKRPDGLWQRPLPPLPTDDFGLPIGD
jgi:hypothetical protein